MLMLKVEGVVKTFGGLKAVDKVSLEVSSGQIVALIGPNGAGKTTLFSAIAGFHTINSGYIEFEGRPIANIAPHKIARQGLVRTFQITQPFARLSVIENIMVGAYQVFSDYDQARAHAESVAKQLGMSKMLDQPSIALTVVGRKKLEIAKALSTSPKLLLLDEVMAGLNPSELIETIEIIEQINRSGVTILLTEHVMQAVMKLSQYIYVLSYGQVIANGTPHDIARNPDVIEAYLGREITDASH
jgi:branched-chain amino acid transport system ATP-binding protein